MPVLERGVPGDGGVEIAGVPQDHGVEDETQTGQLVLLALSVCPADLAPVAMAVSAGKAVAGLLHGELPVHKPAVGVVDRADQGEQVHGLVDAAALGERGAERGGMSLVL